VLEHPPLTWPHDEDRKEDNIPQRCANLLRGKETIDVILLLSFAVHSSYHFSARSYEHSDGTSTGKAAMHSVSNTKHNTLHPADRKSSRGVLLGSEKVFCVLSVSKAQVHPSTNCDRYNAHIYSMPFEDGSTTMSIV